MVNALIQIGILGAVLGLLLGISSKYLAVKEDPRIEKIVTMLPNFNCGSCGYPGCQGMAEGIVAGEAQLTQCKPGNEKMRIEIKEFLDNYQQ